MSELNEKQKAWMLKEEASILQQFPGDPYDSETETEQFLEKMEELHEKTKQNAEVRRWLLIIMRYYDDRHKILSGHGMTQAELLKEYAERLERYKQEERRREEDDGK
ncbi:MAG: hypothetical protein IKG19_03950 [Lachnospiraceae bacterium]|nr:hypothetical protein [Lachnospiraceae bacterium]